MAADTETSRRSNEVDRESILHPSHINYQNFHDNNTEIDPAMAAGKFLFHLYRRRPILTIIVLEEGDIVSGIRKYEVSAWANIWASIRAPGKLMPRLFMEGHTISVENGAERVCGELRAMSEIYNTMPAIGPKPRGYGECHNNRGTHFLVCDFLDVTHGLPNPERLSRTLAELHHKSLSPNGQFGFYCTTFDGEQPLTTSWDSS
ncbi:hypothetical protein F5B22DRAFT_644706 [Xylaria bambusicola]|uniref:uncharacterized protein n=1 Tax=Xylaria bambusicola TaxID=326684 RepID=UPI002007EA7F|nr:uncharacterized protein F5B22DRAFT_644706 [Xylaria bambusicola]KAI0518402.1 hypothetical protein F5B22DRAFT_644706 [Xylaria bambusicola]